MVARYILGMHGGSVSDGYESTGARLMEDLPGPVTFTERLGADPNDHSGGDYRPWTTRGFWPLVRLNYEYPPDGTIPPFGLRTSGAVRVANYVASSQPKGLRWIIGNEMNMAGEGGFLPTDYAPYFDMVYDAIKLIDPLAQVIVGAVAPWNNQTAYPGNVNGDWVNYLADILGLLDAYDGVAIHSYTHGHDPALITDMRPMGPPFEHRFYEFRAYQDFMSVIPAGVPVVLTETNPGARADHRFWDDVDNGWIVAAVSEVALWNLGHPLHQIGAVCCYRYPHFDTWYMEGKDALLQDFSKAKALGIVWDDRGGGDDGGDDVDFVEIYRTSMKNFYEYPENGVPQAEVTVEGDAVPLYEHHTGNGAWLPRPEFKPKDTRLGQPEVLTPPLAAGFFSLDSTMEAAEVWRVAVTPGSQVRALIWSMTVDDEQSGVVTRLGAATEDPGEGAIEVDATASGGKFTGALEGRAQWGGWQQHDPGDWGQLTTPTVTATGPYVWILANGRKDWARSGHVHFDDLLVESTEESGEPPVEPPVGEYRVVVYDPAGRVVVSVPFDATSVDAQVCGLAQQIVGLTCPGK